MDTYWGAMILLTRFIQSPQWDHSNNICFKISALFQMFYLGYHLSPVHALRSKSLSFYEAVQKISKGHSFFCISFSNSQKSRDKNDLSRAFMKLQNCISSHKLRQIPSDSRFSKNFLVFLRFRFQFSSEIWWEEILLLLFSRSNIATFYVKITQLLKDQNGSKIEK